VDPAGSIKFIFLPYLLLILNVLYVYIRQGYQVSGGVRENALRGGLQGDVRERGGETPSRSRGDRASPCPCGPDGGRGRPEGKGAR
jgi:hypothetical protein